MAISGIGSGMDISGMVKAMVGAESAPKTAQLDRLEKTTTNKVSGLGQFRSALSTFQSALGKLNDVSLFEKRSATSSASDIVSIKAESSASAGKYNVQVMNLAQSSKVALASTTNASDSLGSGTLSIKVGEEALDIDLTDASLSDVRDAINAAGKDSGLSASIISDPKGGGSRLVLSSNTFGAGNDINVTVSDDASADLKKLAFTPPAENSGETPADDAARVISYSKDANFAIDGIKMSSSSNTIEDAIEGVTLTLNKAQSAEALEKFETVNLGVTEDKGAVRKSITEFVDAYNAMFDSIDKLTGVTSVGGEDKKPVVGALVGDSSVRAFMSAMRSEMGTPGTSEGMRLLSDIGITTQRDGKLAVDTGKMNSAVDNNFDQVKDFFTGDKGLMARMDSKVKPYTDSDGVLAGRTKALQNTLSGVDAERETLTARVAKLEGRLFAQFNAMDMLVSQLNSTSSFLTSQLDNLPGVVKQNNR
ncbi:MAG TPA: flagellar filament capping protein FliD [Thiopseudomonas sp.]|nr:flagellar filament capping protein FliD [Thiopseudomonas sp.]